MVRAVPEYSRSKVDAAGTTLVRDEAAPREIADALSVVNNWRTSHGFILNTFQTNLRKKAASIDAEAFVVQRLKRRSSIESKLRRFSQMKLSKMQDIGGCRVVLSNINKVNEMVEKFKGSRIKHRLSREDNYLDHPKDSGYRSIHLIYRYYSDKKPTYNDMRVEIQFRSRLQHAWATAVETIDTFSQQVLKSSEGEQNWIRFFALMGSEIAITEKYPLVPNTPVDRKELRREIAEYQREVDAINRLEGYGIALQALEDRVARGGRGYYLLVLDHEIDSWTIRMHEYNQSQIEEATQHYAEVEEQIREQEGSEAVLVNVDSLDALRRAYPNYFADTQVFVRELRKAIG